MKDEIRTIAGRPMLVCAASGPQIASEADAGAQVWFMPDLAALEQRLTLLRTL